MHQYGPAQIFAVYQVIQAPTLYSPETLVIFESSVRRDFKFYTRSATTKFHPTLH